MLLTPTLCDIDAQVMPYRRLAEALRCNDSDLSVSAWLSCFRAAPVDELLQAARASSEWPLQFAPHVDIRTLKTAPSSIPHTVVAGGGRGR
ncbi:hypothetical protein MRX96_025687 [Rhipicephalus microplus]